VSWVGQKNKRKNWAREKKEAEGKKIYWPSKLSPEGQFHPIHEIPEQAFLDGAPVGAGSLKPNKMPLSKLVVAEVFTIE